MIGALEVSHRLAETRQNDDSQCAIPLSAACRAILYTTDSVKCCDEAGICESPRPCTYWL